MNQLITPFLRLRRATFVSPFLVLALSLAAAAPSQAQQTASPTDFPVVPGMRVRVTATGLAVPLIGSFLQQKGDTAIFIEDGVGRGVWSLEIAEIVRIEQSIGQRRMNRAPMLKGAMWGALPGTVLAYTFTALASPSDTSRKYNRFATSMIGGVVGALGGAAVGSRYTREHWSPVAFARRVSVVPDRRGTRVGVSFTF